MKEKAGNIIIIYEKIISDGFQASEPWEPQNIQ